MIRMQMGGKRVVGRPTQLIYISDIYLLFVDDQHRNTNMNDKDHLVGQLTRKKEDGAVLERVGIEAAMGML